jgi:D-methionine transport system substrate-binding protein
MGNFPARAVGAEKENIMKKKLVAAFTAAVLGSAVLAGCGSSSSSDTAATTAATAAATEAAADTASTEAAADTASTETAAAADGDTTITVAASQTQHSEILEQAKSILADEGYDLEVTVFEDYVQPNNVVESGDFDANYFQHVNYLNSFNEENGTHLVVATNGKIHYEPFGIYGGTKKSLDDVADGDAIAIPNDTTNEARALLLLQQVGLIKLADGVGVTATVNDVTENPHNLQLVEVEAAQVAKQLPSVAFGVINGNYALENGLSVDKDALATESADGDAIQQYVNVIAVKDGNQDLPKIKALTDALHSDTVVNYINDTYQGAVVPYDGEQ